MIKFAPMKPETVIYGVVALGIIYTMYRVKNAVGDVIDLVNPMNVLAPLVNDWRAYGQTTVPDLTSTAKPGATIAKSDAVNKVLTGSKSVIWSL